jgi:anion-transporting  ArsA/GET3 family ATPase
MIVELIKDPETGELILPLSDEIFENLGWEIGDTIQWIDNKDGSWTMKKIEETQLVLVETVSMFRQRYMVEVPIGTDEQENDKSLWALDTVTCNEAKEFSQEHLGETIVSHRVVSKKEAMSLCDVDNAYASNWNDDMKVKAFYTPWEDKE